MKKCLSSHCYCRMRNDGVFFCCQCGKIEGEPELVQKSLQTLKN